VQKPNFEKLKSKGLFNAEILPGYTMGDGRSVREVKERGVKTSWSPEDVWANLHKIANRKDAVEFLELEPERTYPGFEEMEAAARKARNQELAETVGMVAKEMTKELVPTLVAAVVEMVEKRLGVAVDPKALVDAASRPAAGPRRTAPTAPTS
jgi:hypothetical protein